MDIDVSQVIAVKIRLVNCIFYQKYFRSIHILKTKCSLLPFIIVELLKQNMLKKILLRTDTVLNGFQKLILRNNSFFPIIKKNIYWTFLPHKVPTRITFLPENIILKIKIKTFSTMKSVYRDKHTSFNN